MAGVIRDDEVELRAFTAADLPQLTAAFADDEIRSWNPGPKPPETAAQWLARRNDWSSREHASWAISDHGGSLLGSVSLHRIDWDQGDAEIGYWVGPWARRRGAGTRAVVLATRFAFEELALHRVYLFHAMENAGSCALAQHAGFRLEGTLRQSYRYADGRYHDEHLHARLATEDQVTVT